MTLGTSFLNELLNKFNEIFSAGMPIVQGQAISLLSVLVVIEITFTGLYWALTGSEIAAKLARKVLVIGFFKYVIDNYALLTASIIGGFSQVGADAAGASAISIQDPSAVVGEGVKLITTIFSFLASQGTMSFFSLGAIVDMIIVLGISFVLFVAYLVLGLQILLCRIEFGLISTLGLILIPFGVFKHTSFITERVFGGIVSYGVKLMVLSFIVAVGGPLIQGYQLAEAPSWPELLSLIPPVVAIAALAIHAPAVVSGLISGAPSLTAGAASAGLAVAGVPAAGAAGIAMSGASPASSGLMKAASSVGSAIKSASSSQATGSGSGVTSQGASGTTTFASPSGSPTPSSGAEVAQAMNGHKASLASNLRSETSQDPSSAKGKSPEDLSSKTSASGEKLSSANAGSAQSGKSKTSSALQSAGKSMNRLKAEAFQGGQGAQGSLSAPIRVHEES